MGYYSWNDHFGRFAFFQSATITDLSHKDKKTVNFAKHKIHGLSFQPFYRHWAYAQDQVDVLLRLYNQYRTKERTVVTYKGGNVEKDLLDKLNISNINLGTWGCPKYQQSKQTIVEPLSSCEWRSKLTLTNPSSDPSLNPGLKFRYPLVSLQSTPVSLQSTTVSLQSFG